MAILTYKQHLFFNVISRKKFNTCPTVSQVAGNLRRKILVVAVGTTRTLLYTALTIHNDRVEASNHVNANANPTFVMYHQNFKFSEFGVSNNGSCKFF